MSSAARMLPAWYCLLVLIGCINSIGVQQVMQEMEKLQAKGEIPEDELRALEEDVTGKVLTFDFDCYILHRLMPAHRSC